MSATINISRILRSSALGFMLVLAIAWASAGCVNYYEAGPDNTPGGVVVAPPPSQPEQPTPPDEPEAWCGLESQVELTDNPTFGEEWTFGHPFEANGGVGHLEVVTTEDPDQILLFLNFHDVQNRFHRYYLSGIVLGPVYVGCSYFVSDVVVDGTRVYVLYSLTCQPGIDPIFGDRLVLLTEVDVEDSLSGLNILWPLEQEVYTNYQLARDGDNLVLGTYNVFSAKLGMRTLRRQGQFISVGEEQVVRGSDMAWMFTDFASFEAVDGLLTYKLANDIGVQTTRYRACD